MDNIHQFYDLQKNHMNDDLKQNNRKLFHDSWFNEETVDFYRHRRMYETIRPIAEYFNDKNWISIGDGRYGLDSARLKKHFGIKVFPTDISENMLKIGKEMGLIVDYGIENAEKLSFADNAYDIVFCKEAFHHFPRPIIALYEMIRVCKIAVIMIEPNDDNCQYKLKRIFKHMFIYFYKYIFTKMIYNQNINFFNNYQKQHNYESSGNYVYAISINEIEKIIHGINLFGLAYMGFNDHYIKGCEFEIAEPDNMMFKEILRTIKKNDFKCRKYPFLYSPNFITTIIFKTYTCKNLMKNMIKYGFTFNETKKNPYVKSV